MFNKIPKFSGLVPDPYDERDIPLSSVQESIIIPKEFKRDLSAIPIDSQGKQPACVGYASSKVKESQELYEHKEFIDISPRFIYALCKRYDGYSGQGTYLRQAMKILQKFGACKESSFPSDTSLSYEEFINWDLITPEIYQEAEKYKIKTYASVPADWEQIKQSIYQNKTVLGGQSGTKEGWSQLPIEPPKEGEKLFGHAIAYFGYDDNYIYFINSWDKGWGNNGIGCFGKNMLPFLFNTWTSVDLETPKDLIGWVATKYLRQSKGFKIGTKVIPIYNLNLRLNPTTGSQKLITIEKNKECEILNDEVVESNGYKWQKIRTTIEE